MSRFAIVASLFMLLSLGAAQAQAPLTEQQARTKAVEFLKGDPYGRTTAQVVANIKEVQLVRDGKTRACGARGKAAWEFHVVVSDRDPPINGYLALDARSGKLMCANLPLLD
jgi:hypothetical protein